MSKLLDIDNEFINDDLILDHMTDISAAATGDADAIDRLRAAAYESILIQLDIDDTSIYGGAQYTLAQIQEYFDSLDLDLGVEIGSIEGSEKYIQSLQSIIDSTKMTSDQVQALLTSMGYDVEFEPSELTTVSQYPVTTTHHHREYIGDPDGNGNYTDWTDWETTDVQYVDAENLTERTGIKISTADGQEAGGQISVAPTETTKLASTNLSNITKHSSGSYNNYSSSNSGGSSPGSSGSSSSDEPDVEDYLEDEIDLYHDINLELQAISTNLSRLQKQESKLTGQALLDNLNDQLATLNDQIDATNVKISIAQGEAADLRSQLSAQGVTFDTAGYITNYAAIMESQLAYVNSCIDAYNAMSAAEQDAYKDTLEAIKQNYQDFVDAISDYDTLISETIPGLEDDIQDAIDEQIEIQITKFTMEVEIRLDMEEAEKDWNEFYRKVILGLDDDDILGNATQDLADILSYFNTTASDITDVSSSNLSDWIAQISEAISNGGTGSIQALTDQVNKTLDQLAQIDESGWADVYGDNQAQALEDLQTYYTELMEQLEDVQDLIDDIEESYLDMIDEAIEAFDEQVDQYEYINDLLNHDVKLINLLYGDDAYAEMANYYAQIEANNNQELDFLKQRVAYAYEMMQAETDEEARQAWQEEWEDALEELNDKVEDAVENIIDQYSNTINQIIDELNDAVTDGLGLDYISEEWDLINDAADIYLDKINAMYGIEEVQQKYLNAINDTDSISAQQKLNDLMEEQLSYLQEKENLTEYDVERAEKLLEIELAQIALEEAQQNKSSMRLRRDSQGNYTYEYVSDNDAVADAQAELLALQNELYNFDKEEYQNNLDEMYSVYKEYQSKLLELYEDQTLSAEEREEKIALYAEYYGEIINALVEENAVIRENLMDSAFAELAALYDVDVENFKNMSAEEQDELMNSLIPQWDSGVQHMADTFAGEGGLIPTCQEALDALNQATEDYQDSLDELEAAAGIDLSSITSGYDEATYAAQDLLAENAELIAQYAEEITAIQNVISQLQELIAQYQAAQAAAEAATAAAYAYWQATQGANASAAASDSSSGTSSYSSSTTGTTSSTSSSGSTQGNGSVEVGDTATFIGGTYYYDSYGTSPKGSRGAGGTVTITSVKTDGRPYPIHVTSTDSAYGWLKKSQLSGYDTGGYTGDWDGSDGALALLHQKELVLNSSDTENILNAVSMVRDVSSLLANLDTSAFDKIFSYVNGLNGFSVYEKANDVLDQNVHIEANFPNVTNSSEIEDAFNNLVNVASQYAYRNAR
ncbi:MAG: hypothetical protein LIO65_02040 [Odoribacter sp.]|nr:hypothetical protein [Odoribacter sp.]